MADETTFMADESTQKSAGVAGNELLDGSALSEQSMSIVPQEGNKNRISDSSNLDQTDSTISFSDPSHFTEKENSMMESMINLMAYSTMFTMQKTESHFCSTPMTFSKFLASLRKEFAGHKSSCTAHAQGQKCVINIHSSENGITVSGLGCRIWRETTFLRLVINLYKQYESETNQHIDESKRQSTAATLTQSSTPTINRKLPDPETPWSPVPSDKSLFHKIETVLNMQTDVKSQVSTLMEMVISLQGQVSQLSSKATDNTRTEENVGIQNVSNVQVDRV